MSNDNKQIESKQNNLTLKIFNINNFTIEEKHCHHIKYESEETLQDFLQLDAEEYESFEKNNQMHEGQANKVYIDSDTQNSIFVPEGGKIELFYSKVNDNSSETTPIKEITNCNLGILNNKCLTLIVDNNNNIHNNNNKTE
jgi:hypothetical protein